MPRSRAWRPAHHNNGNREVGLIADQERDVPKRRELVSGRRGRRRRRTSFFSVKTDDSVDPDNIAKDLDNPTSPNLHISRVLQTRLLLLRG